MSIPIGKSQKRTASKDGGVDVIVWKPFKDNKIGFAAILAQCTVAIDWPPKSKDIGTDLWRGHLDFGKDPITALAIPFVVPSQFDKWDELSRNVHLVLDRLRLCELLEGITLSNKADFDRWVVDELKSMKQH
jgi:hypothetical protein